MASTQGETIAELQRANAELRRELSKRDAVLARRDSDYDERIAHQAATVDVLKAMSASPGDAQPVFDLICRQARSLLNVIAVALFEYDGTLVHFRALDGDYATTNAEAHAAYVRAWPRLPDRGSLSCRAILDGTIVHVRDLSAEPGISQAVRDLGHKTQVTIPLLRDGRAIGALTTSSPLVDGVTDTQIELLRTFAEQAAIAIGGAETYRALKTRTADLQESLEYQTATSDVLKVISRSTFDLDPVLAAVAETAARLCDSDQAMISRYEDGVMWLGANFGFPPEYEARVRSNGRMPISDDNLTVSARAYREGRVVHVKDVAAVPGYSRVAIELGKQRTSLGVPLLRDGQTIGCIVLARQRVEQFTERQIELVRTFADQAVIAIENTRLMTEQREALEQQTATAEVLRVINASPGDLAPVFQTMLDRALRLCGAAFGELARIDGEITTTVAVSGMSAAFSQVRVGSQLRPGPGTASWRFRHGETLVHIADLVDTDAYRDSDPVRRALVDDGGVRALLALPLRKDDGLLGLISIFRQEPGAFTGKQIALLENFAAQAVIAMENARLLTEQQEALERQTATAEVLQVINASPGNLHPVFHAMLEKAMDLCEASFGMLRTFDGEYWQAAATINVPEAVQAHWRTPAKTSPGGAHGRLVRGERVVHSDVAKSDEGYLSGFPSAVALIDVAGARTYLAVALRQDERLLGSITIYRQEARPFTARQIALLEDFAAQAVIAMENARLVAETREALEQQTATAEVLQVINASPGELTPVFDAILEKSLRICRSAFGSLSIYDAGETYRLVSECGVTPALAEFRRNNPSGRGYSANLRQLIETGRPVHILDIREGEGYRSGHPAPRAVADLGGARTLLLVPLLKDETVIGGIQIYRQEVRAFGEKEIALLESFAAQAVIAMENARLLNEIRQRQSELNITFENMGDGVAMFDREQKLAAWNRNFQDILDLPDDAVRVGLPFAEYVRGLAENGEYGPDADADEQIARLIALLDQANRFERIRPNGRVIDIRQNPISGGGFVIIYADITERKRAEEALRTARDAAEQALRDLKLAQANLVQAEKMASLGQLTAGIAHEIKNPLNFVNNFASLSIDLLAELKEAAAPGFAALTEDQRAEVDEFSDMLTGNLQKITEHGRRADGIVKAMLEHSRGASGERREVDINALADEALNLAYHGARAQDQSFNIALERDFGEGIARIELNPQDITRVLLNLFGNGFYAATRRARNGATPGFSPTLRLATRDLGSAVEIRVRDNGTGIPEDIRDKLFQPFFTTKPTGEGTGLGLSITYDIVTKAHGGTISVESEVDEFTEFVVSLPRVLFTNE